MKRPERKTSNKEWKRRMRQRRRRALSTGRLYLRDEGEGHKGRERMSTTALMITSLIS